MSFDPVARVYHLVEALVFGRTLQRARVAWLGEVADARRALIVGEGDGRFLEQLLVIAPSVEVVCVDGSAGMLSVASKRIGASERVQFVHADLGAYEPTGRYDLVVTHFVLDCFDEPGVAALAARLTATLAPGGRWLLADFRVPTGVLRALRARFWLAVMYRFFRIATKLRVKRLVDPTSILELNGLVRARWTELDAGFVGTALWASPATASPRP
jgi:ubiquinone/menaquinone biosynthesis C-methylase UbiE